jgi:hypothetical protein
VGYDIVWMDPPKQPLDIDETIRKLDREWWRAELVRLMCDTGGSWALAEQTTPPEPHKG